MWGLPEIRGVLAPAAPSTCAAGEPVGVERFTFKISRFPFRAPSCYNENLLKALWVLYLGI